MKSHRSDYKFANMPHLSQIKTYKTLYLRQDLHLHSLSLIVEQCIPRRLVMLLAKQLRLVRLVQGHGAAEPAAGHAAVDRPQVAHRVGGTEVAGGERAAAVAAAAESVEVQLGRGVGRQVWAVI